MANAQKRSSEGQVRKTSVAITSATLSKLKDVQSIVNASNQFKSVSESDVLDAIFKKKPEEIINFVNDNTELIVVADVSQFESRPQNTSRQLRVPKFRSKNSGKRKGQRLDAKWRAEKVKELLEKGNTMVKTTKEANSLYNHFKHAGTGKVSYTSQKRGGIQVKLGQGVPTVTKS